MRTDVRAVVAGDGGIMENVRTRDVRWAGVALVVAAVAACSSGSVDKQGANTAPTVRNLRIGLPDGGDPGAAVFAKAVEERSKGRLTITLDSTTYASGDPKNEAKLVADLKAGAVEGGYMPSRDWAADAVPSFVLVQTPFLLSTLDAEVQLAKSPVADAVLAGLRAHGVEGLALVPSEVRQILTRAPWLDGDLRGAKIRIVDNPQTAAMVKQLGGTPVQGYEADEVEPALKAGKLDGVESSPTFFAPQYYHERAPYLTGFGVLPKFQVAVIGNGVWSSLSGPDRESLRAAAQDAVAAAEKSVAASTSKYLTQACRDGAVIQQPSPAVLAALAAKSTPSAAEGPLLAQLRAAVPLAGPRLMPVPATCRLATTDIQARALAAAGPDKLPTLTPSKNFAAKFPVGTYTTTHTVAEFHSVGATGTDWDADVTWTMIFNADGTYRQTQQPDYPEQGAVEGVWEVKGDVLTITYHFLGEPDETLTETARWSYRDGSLRFTEVAGEDDFAEMWWTKHPWRRVR
jgi:TRAP-type C4-dicarboxylate transport system substrate-binding protein